MNETKERLSRIKEKIDFIYSVTNGVNYNDGFKVFGDRFLEECVTALVKRCILQKTKYYVKGKVGAHYTFTWIASMAPTETLYINIYKDIQEVRKVKRERWKMAKRNQRQREETLNKYNNATSIPNITQAKQESTSKQLCDYTPQELWDELRARGYQIEENKIVFIQKTYLD